MNSELEVYLIEVAEKLKESPKPKTAMPIYTLLAAINARWEGLLYHLLADFCLALQEHLENKSTALPSSDVVLKDIFKKAKS